MIIGKVDCNHSVVMEHGKVIILEFSPPVEGDPPDDPDWYPCTCPLLGAFSFKDFREY